MSWSSPVTATPVLARPAQLEQLLTVLTQAGARAPVREALSRLLAAHLPDLLTATLDAPAGRLPDLLDLALVHCPQPGAAAALVAGLPERSTGLAALAATLSSQAVDHHRQLAGRPPRRAQPRSAGGAEQPGQPAG